MQMSITRTFGAVSVGDESVDYSFVENGGAGASVPRSTQDLGADLATAYAQAAETVGEKLLEIGVVHVDAQFAEAGVPYTNTDIKNALDAMFKDKVIHIDLSGTGQIVSFS